MMNLPKELLDKLETAKSDVQACKMLADNGIDPEEFEKTIPSDFLNQVNGGYDSFGIDIHCPNCNVGDKDLISRQFWASMFTDSATKYRCRKCNTYFKVSSYGVISKY